MQNILQNALYIKLTLVYAAIISYFQTHKTNKGKTLPSFVITLHNEYSTQPQGNTLSYFKVSYRNLNSLSLSFCKIKERRKGTGHADMTAVVLRFWDGETGDLALLVFDCLGCSPSINQAIAKRKISELFGHL